MNGKQYNGETLEYLKSKGYRQVSRKYKMISRIELSDEALIKFFIDRNFGSKKSGLPSCSLEQQKDHYRRCYSEDAIEGVPESIFKHLRD